MARIRAFIRLCARRQLPPEVGQRLAALGSQFSEVEWSHLVEMARAERVASLVFLHVAAVELLQSMPVAAVDALRHSYQLTLISNRRMQAVEAELLSRLHTNGIRVLALKGLALTFRYYGELGLRPITDIDLLIEHAQVPAVCAILREMGYHPSSGSGRPNGFSAQTHAVLDYVHERGPQIEIQINGRGERLLHEHVEDDIYYVRNYSFLLDCKILLMTVRAMISGRGAF